MIETITAARNAEEIMRAGVDGCFIGPNDLALSMGLDLGDAAMRSRRSCRRS